MRKLMSTIYTTELERGWEVGIIYEEIFLEGRTESLVDGRIGRPVQGSPCISEICGTHPVGPKSLHKVTNQRPTSHEFRTQYPIPGAKYGVPRFVGYTSIRV